MSSRLAPLDAPVLPFRRALECGSFPTLTRLVEHPPSRHPGELIQEDFHPWVARRCRPQAGCHRLGALGLVLVGGPVRPAIASSR
jgi:hypothetical protein